MSQFYDRHAFAHDFKQNNQVPKQRKQKAIWNKTKHMDKKERKNIVSEFSKKPLVQYPEKTHCHKQ